MEKLVIMRAFDSETVKIWMVNLGALLITLSEAMGAIVSFVGSLAAATYTIWRIVLLYKEQKKKTK